MFVSLPFLALLLLSHDDEILKFLENLFMISSRCSSHIYDPTIVRRLGVIFSIRRSRSDVKIPMLFALL